VRFSITPPFTTTLVGVGTALFAKTVNEILQGMEKIYVNFCCQSIRQTVVSSSLTSKWLVEYKTRLKITLQSLPVHGASKGYNKVKTHVTYSSKQRLMTTKKSFLPTIVFTYTSAFYPRAKL
jgi:hypothetical protein